MKNNQKNTLYVGALLLEDGDEIPCCSPIENEYEAWKIALKKKYEYEIQEIEVVDTYVFTVANRP
jgi:hypothetical protein